MDVFRLLVIGVLVAIVWALGTACLHLVRGNGDSDRMLRALTWRVGMSVALFLLLMAAARFGWIEPHDLTH